MINRAAAGSSLKHIVLGLLLASSAGAVAQPLSTTFTYQGELRVSGLPATGLHDLRFRLFDAVTGGSQVGPTLCADNVSPVGGRFTVELDFLANFGGQQRFLAIEVRADSGLDCSNAAGFVALAPRQPLTAAPNALFALNAAAATTATNTTQLNGQAATFYQNAANLSTGTIPSARLSGTYSGVLSLNNTGNTFAGNGAGLGNVNADLLDGLDSTAFLQSIPMPLHLSGTHPLAIIGGFNSSTSFDAAGVAGYSYATTGSAKGVYAVSHSNEGMGVFGWALAPAGTTYGVFGLSNSPVGHGVLGRALADTGINYGVFGVSNSAAGSGVFGQATALGGITYGGRFESASTSGFAVFGRASASSGTTYGARFETASTGGRGIFAYASAGSGSTYGAYFQCDSNAGRAVFGWATAGSGAAYGGTFESASTAGRGVYGLASAATGITSGVFGLSTSVDGRGVFGQANSGAGGTNGVRGESNSPDGRGVLGFASATNGPGYGVRGQSDSPSGYGVYAVGALGAGGTKSFRIDHPDDPANKYLLHYSAESPEVINFYSGKATLDSAGGAVIELPHYFAKINRDPRYTLTAVGAPMPMLHIAQEIDESALSIGAGAEPGAAAPLCSFRIAGGAPGAKVSWRIEAVRNDRWVQQHGAPVEVQKQGLEQGAYQHPELYGQPQEMGMNWSARQTAADNPASASDQQ